MNTKTPNIMMIIYTIYLSLSLFSIMTCEFITTLQTGLLSIGNGGAGADYSYILYSFSVSAGILLFYFFKIYIKNKKAHDILLIMCFSIAIVSVTALFLASDILLFQVIILLVFLLAGFNTGIASYTLYILYQQKYPVGKILSLASLIGLTAHYIVCLLLNNNRYAPRFLGAAVIICIIVMGYIVISKISIFDKINVTPDDAYYTLSGNTDYIIMLFSIAAVIAVISFIIGISDYLVAEAMPVHIMGESFFYPVLFYIPGQVIACLLADTKNGRYLPVTTLAGAIILIPVTLFLESPDEFYLNSGINFFIGGFFLAYIMTVMISNVRPYKYTIAVICLPGFIYSLFCGAGALATRLIFIHMNVYFILTGYSILIIALVVSIFISVFTMYKAGMQVEKPETTVQPAAAESAFDAEETVKKYSLTAREREILPYLLSTMTTEEIASELHITVNTLKTHIRNVLGKTDTSSRRELRRLITDEARLLKKE